MPTQPYSAGADETAQCPQCRSMNDTDAVYCDQCGTSMPGQVTPYQRDPGDTQQCRCGEWNAPDAKICDQCGQSLVNDHDEDDGYPAMAGYSAGGPYELRAKYDTDDRKRMAASGQAMKDGSYPIADEQDLQNAIRAVGRGGADHDAIRRHIIARAKALGKSSMIPDHWGADGSLGQRAAGMPLERRASASEDMDLAGASDYDAAAADHPYDGTHTHAHPDYEGGEHVHEHTHNGDGDHGHGHSANVMVDGETGIPGEETQFSARRRLELRLRELELDVLASRC